MLTIVCNSQKGGSGKTTLCRILSVQAARELKKVYLIDTDTQGTLTQWHEAREAEEPRRVELPIESLREGLALLSAQGADYVLIDTPPQASATLHEVFDLADIVLVPIKPTSDDLKAAAVTVARLKDMGVPFLFVITQAITHTNITAQAIAALSHHGPVAHTIIANRVAYPTAFTDGRSPQELDQRGSAAREITQLWEDIKACLHENMKKGRSKKNG